MTRFRTLEEVNAQQGDQRLQRMPETGVHGHEIVDRRQREEGECEEPCAVDSPLERQEKLEQLRALEAGMRIDIGIVDTVPRGVDTPADLETARRILAKT